MDASNRLRRLREGLVITAHPLALNARREIDERRQRALTRYYVDAGAGGIAVGVHTTQFSIREHGLYEPVLAMAAAESRDRSVLKVAGVCGPRSQAVKEAECAATLGYDAALLSLAAVPGSNGQLIEHSSAVGAVLPLIG